jgi:hypothetical protein
MKQASRALIESDPSVAERAIASDAEIDAHRAWWRARGPRAVGAATSGPRSYGRGEQVPDREIERPRVAAQHRMVPSSGRDMGRSVPLPTLGTEAEGPCDGNQGRRQDPR